MYTVQPIVLSIRPLAIVPWAEYRWDKNGVGQDLGSSAKGAWIPSQLGVGFLFDDLAVGLYRVFTRLTGMLYRYGGPHGWSWSSLEPHIHFQE